MNKRGITILAALLISFIFLALGLSLMLLVKATARQADIDRNNFIAYNLAESGVADALFRLNYSIESGYFPFDGSPGPSNNLATSKVSGQFKLETGNDNQPIQDVVYRKYVGSFGDHYTAKVVPVDSAAPEPRQYKIVAEGFYKSSYKKVEMRLRGKQNSGVGRQDSNQGISEAFNKHAVYANTVRGKSSPSGMNVTGNIFCVIPPGAEFVGGDTSLTQLNPSLFPAQSDFATYWVPIYTPSSPPAITLPVADRKFKDMTAGDGHYDNTGVGYVSTSDFQTFYSSSIIYNDVSDNYQITGNDGAGARWQFEPRGASPIPISITGTNHDVSVTNGTITVSAGAGTSADVALYAGGNITINNGTIAGDVLAGNGGNLTINGGTINGDVLGDGDITVDASSANITINGALYSNGTIIIKNASAHTITINAGDSSQEAALLASSAIDIKDTVFPGWLAITLGQNQKCALLAAGSGTASITISGDLKPTYDNSTGWHGQAAMIACSFGGAVSTVIINASIDDSGMTGRGRLIYAYGGVGSGITLNSGIVYGSLVTNGTVWLTGTGTLSTNGPSATSLFKNVPQDSDIYQGFSGGRRVYLPAIGGWK